VGLKLKPADGGATLVVDRSPFLVGRHPASDLIIDRPEINRRQSLIVHYNRGWVIHDLASANGFRVNGRRKIDSELYPGDILALGKSSWTVLEAGLPTAGDDPGDSENLAADLIGEIDSPGMEACGLIFRLDGNRLGSALVIARAIIGHADRADVQLPKRSIGTLQALVVRRDGAWFCHDLRTKGGIIRDGASHESVRLEDGLLLGMGDFQVEVRSRPLPEKWREMVADPEANRGDPTTAVRPGQPRLNDLPNPEDSFNEAAEAIGLDSVGSIGSRVMVGHGDHMDDRHRNWLSEARQAQLEGDFNRCHDRIRRIVKAFPDRLEYRQLLRRSQRKLARRRPSVYPWWNLPLLIPIQAASWMSLQWGSVDGGLRWAERGLRLDPFNPALHLIEAWAFERKNQGKACAWALSLARLRDESNLHVLRPLARLLQLNGDYERAINIWQTVHRLAPDDREAPEQLRMAMVQKTLRKGSYRGLSLRDEQAEDVTTSWAE
jgi:hypothetical protein